MTPACTATWAPIVTPPKAAGVYLVGNLMRNLVNQARWMPKKRQWKFPSAAMAFEIQVWTVLPKLPTT